jgi:hypothetical protein
MSKTKAIISFTLIFVLILLPTAAFAKSFDSPNTLDPKYNGTNLTINKLKVSVNQTVRVKLTLKQNSKKAPRVAAKLNIVKTVGSTITIPDLSGMTSPSGKVLWKFKIRDYDPTAVAGDTFTLTVSITDANGNKVIIGSTDVIVR